MNNNADEGANNIMPGQSPESLPRLIAQAAAALAKATTAAEVLDAIDQAKVGYTAAKTAARLSKIKAAHAAVLAACRKAMADALVIEARAQCRLADEYDAAQARGEVKGHGNKKKSEVPNENLTLTLADIGITKKQVHAARAIRDAEKAKPGIVRETVEERVQANEDPTRADVKRVVKEISRPKSIIKTTLPPRHPRHEPDDEERISPQQVTAEIRQQMSAEYQARPNLTAKGKIKLDDAIRIHKARLDKHFEQRVNAEVRRRIDAADNEAREQNKRLRQENLAMHRIINQQAPLTIAQFKVLRNCLHPDKILRFKDKELDEMFSKAAMLLDEKERSLVGKKK